MKPMTRLAALLFLSIPLMGCDDRPSVSIEDGDEEAIAKYEAMLAAEGEGDKDLDAP
ncbi:hypothetical protein K227x_62970 [Rubripirellula lacrimiformis]|uniref:Uncharacterized protein n=1 Tax=Rubripirellula lacrimiformis TaxID=1930273 RepID=A0A517NL49_9BACT|nr:hypothetical protein [Rubripirellula lacrimiformis]QDT07868.1 hypothetical protein K227x_62970 [Rubripirellula lacrimiformis]